MLKGKPGEDLVTTFNLRETSFRQVRWGAKVVMTYVDPTAGDFGDIQDDHIMLNNEDFDYKIVKIDGVDFLRIEKKPEVPEIAGPQALEIEEPKKSKKK